MNKFEIFNETNEKIIEIETIKKLLDYAILKKDLKNVVFNVIIVNDDVIKDINNKYRGIDKSTDVISFALEDTPDIEYDFRILGDIYISIDQAKRQATQYQHSFLRELSFLVIHGLLHLLGYNHISEEEEKIMFEEQERILNGYGIKREK